MSNKVRGIIPPTSKRAASQEKVDVTKPTVRHFERAVDMLEEGKRTLASAQQDPIRVIPLRFVRVATDDLRKNRRRFPCTIEVVREHDWPSIDLPVEEAINELESKFDQNIFDPEWTDAELREFFAEIHSLAKKISKRLIHPIYVQQGNHSDDFILVAGHRRLFAATYAKMDEIRATVRREELSELEWAEIMGDENEARRELKLDEQIESRRQRYEAALKAQQKEKLTVDEIAELLSMSRSLAGYYRRIFVSQFREDLLKEIRAGNVTGIKEAYQWIHDAEQSKKPKVKRVRTNIRQAFGLSILPQHDLRAVPKIIDILCNSGDLDEAIVAEIDNLDLTQRAGMLRAWMLINEHLISTAEVTG